MATRGADTGRRSGAVQHEGFLRHRRFRWAKIAAAAAIGATLLYALDDPQPPSGGTAFGYASGTAGALLILWLTAIGVRKRATTRRRWSLKGWTSAHVYLGLALLVVATLHTGFQFGWNVHTLAYAIMLVVIASGVLGVSFYASLPRAMSDNRGEMTEVQMVEALRAIDRQLRDASQPLEQALAGEVQSALAEDPFDAGILRRLRGHFPPGGTQAALNTLRAACRARRDDVAAARVETLLERRCSILARMRRHMRLKALLQGWLYLHVPLSIALLAALTAHIVAIFFYW